MAAQIGPISLLCVRSVLRGRLSAARAVRTAVVATASNPLTILSWAAIFAAARRHA